MNINLNTMPKLGMGTFRLEDKVAYSSVKMALEVGYKHIDTAQIYGNEAQVGQAISDSGIPRADIFITTKVWNANLNKASFIDSVKESLSKLQTDYVDLLLIHWPSPENNEPMEEYLGELVKAKELGLAKNIGVSNFSIDLLKQAMAILPNGEIFTNQVEVHPYLTNESLREFCSENNIHVTGYMPFAVGKVLKDETIIEIANSHNKAPSEVVIAWALANGLTTIPSSTKRSNLITNLAGPDLTLSAKEITAIDQLNKNDRQASPDFSPLWDN
ncbi:2,5-didehydrogluconate reductase DkgB [Pseudoalteromonas carrageenovora]|uniref:2,5-didehydrogluconate reductase DkgB n=1 Tax=Pseudoalteromonas carrageenovora TaxID=227 RepID=UPI002FD76B82